MRPLFFILLLSFADIISAQQPSHFVLGEEELSGIDIYGLLQDAENNYWIATDNGIFKYDGYSFIKIECEGMTGSSVFNLKMDKNNLIYCNNLSGQIFQVKNDSCVVYFQTPEELMHQQLGFAFDNQNTLTVSTNVLFQVYKDKSVHILYDKSGYFSSIPSSIDDETLVIYHIQEEELIQIKNKKIKVKKYPDLYKQFRLNTHLLLNVEGKNFWFHQNTGEICDYEEEGFGRQRLQVMQEGFLVHYALGDKIWTSFLSGGIIPFSQNFESLSHGEKYFKSNIISSLLLDNEGNIILGTFGDGLLVIPNSGTKEIDLGDLNIKPTKISSTEKGDVFFGTQSGDIYQIDKKNKVRLFHKEGLKLIEVLEYIEVINCLITDGAQPKLLNLKGGGIQFLDFGAVKDIEKSWKNQYLISTHVGLKIYSPAEKPINFEALYNFRERTNCAVFDTINNMIYAGSSQGLKIGNENQAEFFEIDGKPIICQDIKFHNGKVFIGTQKKGILVFSKGILVDEWGLDKGLFSKNIKQIILDEDLFYVATDNGLNVLDLNGNLVYALNKSEGLYSNQIIDFVVTEKFIWIVHNKGIQKVEKKGLKKFDFVPNITIVSISVNENKLEHNTKEEKFEHNQNKFIFTLSSKSLKYKNEIKYQYKLEGLDENWMLNDYEDNLLEYKSLAPGEYCFKAKAVCRNNFSEVLSYKFIIAKPFWFNWWFISFIGITGVGLTIFIVRFQYQRKQKKALLKSELISSKLIAIQSQMNPHFIFNSLNSIQDLVLQQNGNSAYNYISKFALLVRKILNHSDRDFIDIDEEFQVLQVYLELEELRFKNDFDFVIHQNDISDLEIPPMIIQPFVENAIKHGLLHKKGRKALEISFNMENEVLNCTVLDNGIGREKSAEIKLRQKEVHDSFSVKSTKSRLDILKNLYGEELGIEFIDLAENGIATGTKVVIKIPFKHKF